MSTTTALDEHKERNTDDGAARDLAARVEQSGVEFIYYQTVSLTGRVVGKVVPARHLRRNLENGVNLHRTAMSDLQVDRFGALLGGGTEAPEFTAMPDLDTFDVLPWDTTVGRFFCSVYEPGQRPGSAGARWPPTRAPTCAGCTPRSPRPPGCGCAAAANRR